METSFTEHMRREDQRERRRKRIASNRNQVETEMEPEREPRNRIEAPPMHALKDTARIMRRRMSR